MPINWKDIRSYENSQNTAFEEVVCQLAHNENQGKGKYRRVKAPDGGVESYLILDDGTEIGWQAKYFFDIQDTQFKQIKKSFHTAIKKHPKLTKYYVCCPVDLQDPRLPDKKYSKDRWDNFVEESIKLAKQEGINIKIVYWGAFELNNMLQKPMNHGMTKFWFGGDDFSDAWFDSQIKTSLTNLGARYSQQLNVEVDEIAAFFDAIQRNSRAKNRVFEQLNELDKALHNLYDRRQSQKLKFDEQNKKLALAIDECWNSVRNNSVNITFEDIKAGLLSLIKNIEEHPPTFDDREQEALFNQSFYAIKDILDGLNQPIFKLFYSPYLIVHGDAGTGKSHLFGDFSDNLMSQNKKCVFILGQSLTSSNNPWTQILKDELRLDCNEDEFLGVLNTIGQAQQERVPFVIDALNEGNGRQFWKNHIAGFIEKFKGYPWVALVLSIRSEYKDDILRNVQDGINSKIISKVEHYGFQRNVFIAIRSFFNHYNLALPREPLMVPEFTNPLFLKIYCKYREQSKADLEFTGLPDVFESYFFGVNNVLSENFSYRPTLRYVQKTLHHLAKAIFHDNQHSISYEHAMQIVDKNTHSINPDVFLQALISENVLIAYHNQQAKEEILHFSFERFQDYLTAQFICEENDSADELRKSLSHEKFYGVSYKSKHLSEGILSILSYLIPAKFGVELYESFDDENIHKNSSISSSFIDSLYWRNADNFNLKSSKEFLNKVITSDDSFSKFIDLLYQVAGKENHPFNATFLHGWLKKHSLSDRDCFWTTHISAYLEDNSAIDVLIDWASESGFSENLSDESRLLIAKAVSWVFTSTNIRLRDQATIGLTRLLQNNLKIATKLILSFKEADDPYVHERIMASTYGAILSSIKHEGLEAICDYLIDDFFAQNEVFPNVLVRDYSRNIVEYAYHKGKFLFDEEQLKLARPPYNSAFPDSLPTVKEIDEKYSYKRDDKTDVEYRYAQNRILNSMTTEYGRGVCGYGDFGRYVFEAHLRDWDSLGTDRLSNFAVQLIFEKYGYNPKKHGNFDRNGTYSTSRSEHIIERIGKKYQWIAMYEVVARLADSYKMTAPETRWTENKKQIWYNGSIEPSFREFDPTFIPASSTENRMIEKPEYDGWDEDFEKWVISKDELIDSKDLLTCQYGDAEWLSLKRYVNLKPEKKIGDNRIFSRYQDFWYHIHAYLVKAEDFNSILSNLKGKNFMGRWMPQPKEYYNDIFNLEFHWSPLLEVYEHDYYGGSGWREIREDSFDSSNRSLGKVYCCSENHIFEGIRNSDLRYDISAPTQLICEALNLKNDKFSGSWLNENNELIAFDASLYGNESSNLLIKKEFIDEIEQKTNTKVIWTVLAEKIAMYENHKSTEKRLEISGIYYLKDGGLTGADDYFIE